ncbi:MAG: putative ABC transport system permease protein [Psychromonas sp.]|jgi:putative ABC transport system permease protein
MRLRDLLHLTVPSLIAHRLRSFLFALGIVVGVAAVVLLTSIGAGVHQFVLVEFTQFGTHLVAVNPGKTTTGGISLGVFGSKRSLTIEDAQALKRLPYGRAVVAFVHGNAEVEVGNRSRHATVYDAVSQMPEAFQMSIKSGHFLPYDDPTTPRTFAVLGSKLKQELFDYLNPLGKRITVGGNRFCIIGVMESKGNILGFDLDDTEDVTITTQQQMLEVLGSVLNVLTFAVGAIGGISLLFGAIGIVTIMTIAVNERISEIG